MARVPSPCPGLTHTGLGSRPPQPLPGTHRSQTRWDLRSPRLTVGVSAAFAETFPGGERWDGEGQLSLSLNRGDLVWSPPWVWSQLMPLPQCQPLWSRDVLPSKGQTDRQTDARALILCPWLSLSLLSQSLQVFKGETPPFFSSASSLRFCSSHCKSKNPNLSAHSFLLYCRGKDLTLSSLPRLPAFPCAVCSENVPRLFF